ncbi:MAG: methylmalonyl-CoA mutase family protein, partial [Candidatus Binataceae bacterium]
KVVEKLTGETTERARTIALGLRASGYSRAIAAVGGELTRLLAERQQKLASGQLVQVGVNAFLDEIGLTGAGTAPDDAAEHAAAERERIASLVQWRRERDARGDGAVARALEALERAAAGDAAVMEPTIDLARAGGTVGEWTAAIERATNGRYTPPVLDSTVALAPLNVPHAPRRIRIALGKAGLDGHINAVKLLAHACMQAGMEVILAGFKQTSGQMVETALQEDAEVLAISSLAGAHIAIARETIALLKERGADEVKLVMGGIIPNRDRQALLEMGVRAVFTPKDSDLGEIVRRIIEVCDGAAA